MPKLICSRKKKVQGVVLTVESGNCPLRTFLCARYGDFYEPSIADHGTDFHPSIDVVDGGNGLGGVTSSEAVEERRRRVLEATMARLRRRGWGLVKHRVVWASIVAVLAKSMTHV